MKKIIVFLASIAFIFGATSCETENEPKKVADDVYYVKYSIVKVGVYGRFRDVYYEDVNGTKNYLDRQLQSWSETIGPVKKGFKASVRNRYGEGTNKIEVSKNNGPFALKASGTNSASYEINF